MPITAATSMSSHALDDILAQFRDDARNNRDLGDRFERMMLGYFETDPLHAERFDRSVCPSPSGPHS